MRPIRGQLAGLALMFQVLKFDPQVLQRAPEEAGDVHLADAYVVCDLGLRLTLVEAKFQDLLLLALEAFDGLLEQDPVLQPLYRRAPAAWATFPSSRSPYGLPPSPTGAAPAGPEGRASPSPCPESSV